MSEAVTGDLAAKRIGVVGVGGAGVHMLRDLERHDGEALHTWAVNTDAQSLAQVEGGKVSSSFLLGKHKLRGLGTGGEMDVAMALAEEEAPLLQEQLGDWDVLILLVGLGGGTGSGVSATIARLAAQKGMLVLAFVSMPFAFEGKRRGAQAKEALGHLRELCDGVFPIANDVLLQEADASLGVEASFRLANQWVSRAVAALAAVVCRQGLIDIDLTMLQRIFRDDEGGEAFFALAESEGAWDVSGLVEQLWLCPLLGNKRVLKDVHTVLIHVLSGPELPVMSLHALSKELTEQLPHVGEVVMGATVYESMAGKAQLCVMAFTGHGRMPYGGKLPVLAESPAAQERVKEEPDEALPVEDETAVLAKKRGAKKKVKVHRSKLGKQEQAIVETQEEFDFTQEDSADGYFHDAAETLVDGVNYDVPTFLRRQIKVSV